MSANRYLPDIILYLFAAGLLLASAVMGYLLWPEDEDDKEARVIVEEVYFKMVRNEGASSDIQIVIFVSNIGDADIDTLKIRAFAIETRSNLAKDDETTSISNIPKMTSGEGNLTVTLPNRDLYRVEILVFKDDRLDIRGSGTIDLTSYEMATDYRTESPSAANDVEDGDGLIRGGSESASSLLCMVLLFTIGGAALLMVIIIAVRRKPDRDLRMWNDRSEDLPVPPGMDKVDQEKASEPKDEEPESKEEPKDEGPPKELPAAPEEEDAEADKDA